MNRMTIQRLITVTGSIFFAAMGQSSAQPQPPAPPAAPAPPPQPPPAPAATPVAAAPAPEPAVAAERARPPISLAEVVRTTIRTHPDIRGAEANLSQRKAELKAARGP